MTEADLRVSDGRSLHLYDTSADGADAHLAVFWHHGTPNLGAHAEGLDWFAGMAASGAAELRAATRGRAALEAYLASTEFDPEQLTPADHAALAGAWSWLAAVAGQAIEGGSSGMVDDELAYVARWGFDPGQARSPVLFLHGGQDRIAPSPHGEWLARRCRSAGLWLRPDDGHISVLDSAAAAMGSLREHANQA